MIQRKQHTIIGNKLESSLRTVEIDDNVCVVKTFVFVFVRHTVVFVGLFDDVLLDGVLVAAAVVGLEIVVP